MSSPTVRFPTEEKLQTRYGSLAGPRRSRGRTAVASLVAALAVTLWVAAAAVVAFRFGGGEALVGLFAQAPVAASAPVASASDRLVATFAICGSDRRVNCVVDGDTFWYAGTKIRVADIDTPELSPPRCEAERVKGEAAKARLRALLDAGPFSLVLGPRDEDRYGRKLRRVTRGGVSLGDVLVREGLARPWDGARHGWCGAGA